MTYTSKLAPYLVEGKGIIIKLICFTLTLKSAYQKLPNDREMYPSILVHDNDVDRIKKLLPRKMRKFVKPLSR